jgi:putative endonuclease
MPSSSSSSVASEKLWFLYMIRCRNQALYTGITTDVLRRFEEHQSQGKRCAKYLRGKGPLRLVYWEKIGTKSLASQAEYRLKRASKQQKEERIQSLFNLQKKEKKAEGEVCEKESKMF